MFKLETANGVSQVKSSLDDCYKKDNYLEPFEW